MEANSERIKVKSVEFGTPPFRKLGSLKIEFADRLTLIAGHNGCQHIWFNHQRQSKELF